MNPRPLPYSLIQLWRERKVGSSVSQWHANIPIYSWIDTITLSLLLTGYRSAQIMTMDKHFMKELRLIIEKEIKTNVVFLWVFLYNVSNGRTERKLYFSVTKFISGTTEWILRFLLISLLYMELQSQFYQLSTSDSLYKQRKLQILLWSTASLERLLSQLTQPIIVLCSGDSQVRILARTPLYRFRIEKKIRHFKSFLIVFKIQCKNFTGTP
jgi:hypothetical protein